MAKRHGGLRSATTGRAKVFRGFKLAGLVLGSLPCLMTAKMENGHVLPSLPSRPVSQNQFCRLMAPFRVDGHIFVPVPLNREQMFCMCGIYLLIELLLLN